MTVVEDQNKMNILSHRDSLIDPFPVGMHVLAVDGDRTCLNTLVTLLQSCQYNVTHAENGKTALNLLLDDKDKLDLVISDVNMPDMDGFKLLEHVRVEGDLPVILLSENADLEMVVKGKSLGACHYMLKPVRIEELRLIWQHAITSKITKSDNQYTKTSYSNQNEKSSEKRKNEGDVEGHENDHANEVLTAPKKPRLVWSDERHSKFVDAVNQLGGRTRLNQKGFFL